MVDVCLELLLDEVSDQQVVQAPVARYQAVYGVQVVLAPAL